MLVHLQRGVQLPPVVGFPWRWRNWLCGGRCLRRRGPAQCPPCGHALLLFLCSFHRAHRAAPLLFPARAGNSDLRLPCVSGCAWHPRPACFFSFVSLQLLRSSSLRAPRCLLVLGKGGRRLSVPLQKTFGFPAPHSHTGSLGPEPTLRASSTSTSDPLDLSDSSSASWTRGGRPLLPWRSPPEAPGRPLLPLFLSSHLPSLACHLPHLVQ
jgi:hypothetical protein